MPTSWCRDCIRESNGIDIPAWCRGHDLRAVRGAFGGVGPMSVRRLAAGRSLFLGEIAPERQRAQPSLAGMAAHVFTGFAVVWVDLEHQLVMTERRHGLVARDSQTRAAGALPAQRVRITGVGLEHFLRDADRRLVVFVRD